MVKVTVMTIDIRYHQKLPTAFAKCQIFDVELVDFHRFSIVFKNKQLVFYSIQFSCLSSEFLASIASLGENN